MMMMTTLCMSEKKICWGALPQNRKYDLPKIALRRVPPAVATTTTPVIYSWVRFNYLFLFQFQLQTRECAMSTKP